MELKGAARAVPNNSHFGPRNFELRLTTKKKYRQTYSERVMKPKGT